MDHEAPSVRTDDAKAYEELREAYLAQLSVPMDDMWMAFSDGARPLSLRLGDRRVGCASVDGEGRLLRFYVEPREQSRSGELLQCIVDDVGPRQMMVSTGDPLALSAALDRGGEVMVDTLLYGVATEPETPGLEGLGWAEPGDHRRIVDFQHREVGAPLGFLEQYVGERIERREMLLDVEDSELRCVGELRRDRQQPGVGHLGLIVHGKARGRGVGSSMMSSLVQRCRAEGLTPRCSTEVGNPGAQRAIERGGFRPDHRWLRVELGAGSGVGPAAGA